MANYNRLIFDNINNVEVIETLLDGYEMKENHCVAILTGFSDETGNLNVTRAHYLPTETYYIDDSYHNELKKHIHIYAEALNECYRDLAIGKEKFVMTVISGKNFSELENLDPIYYGTEQIGGKRFAELSKKVTIIGGFIGLDERLLVEVHDNGDIKRFLMPIFVKENDHLIALEDYYEDDIEMYLDETSGETHFTKNDKKRERK